MKRFSSRLFVWAMIMLIAGCKNFHGPTEPIYTSSSNNISLSASAWEIKYGFGMPSQPSPASQGGWYLDIPNSGAGLLGNVETSYRGAGLLHKTLTATFEIQTDGPTEYDATTGGDTNPAYVCLFIEQANDNMNKDEYGRWWAGTHRYQLGSADNRSFSISAELSYNNWTSVHGQTSQSEFEAALNNVGRVGLTFGGASFYGHGVSLKNGRARFRLIDYTIQ